MIIYEKSGDFFREDHFVLGKTARKRAMGKTVRKRTLGRNDKAIILRAKRKASERSGSPQSEAESFRAKRKASEQSGKPQSEAEILREKRKSSERSGNPQSEAEIPRAKRKSSAPHQKKIGASRMGSSERVYERLKLECVVNELVVLTVNCELNSD